MFDTMNWCRLIVFRHFEAGKLRITHASMITLSFEYETGITQFNLCTIVCLRINPFHYWASRNSRHHTDQDETKSSLVQHCYKLKTWFLKNFENGISLWSVALLDALTSVAKYFPGIQFTFKRFATFYAFDGGKKCVHLSSASSIQSIS